MGITTTVVPDSLNFHHPPPSLHLRQGRKLLADCISMRQLGAAVIDSHWIRLAGPRDTRPERAAPAI